jgi:hypothetical protein
VDSEKYLRLHAAFKTLAEQSYGSDDRARWLAMALASSRLAEDPPLNPKAWCTEETENARVALLLNSLASASR